MLLEKTRHLLGLVSPTVRVEKEAFLLDQLPGTHHQEMHCDGIAAGGKTDVVFILLRVARNNALLLYDSCDVDERIP